MNYQPDLPQTPADLALIRKAVLKLRTTPSSPTSSGILGDASRAYPWLVAAGGLQPRPSVPWLYRLTFHTKGLRKDPDGTIHEVSSHTLAVRFLPDYLRRANRFAMLRLIEPQSVFHPNITPLGDPQGPGLVCLEVYPGMPLIELVHAIHDLLRWRIRQYDERDALNYEACSWGRDHVDQPLDDRPLFGRRLQVQLADSPEEPSS